MIHNGAPLLLSTYYKASYIELCNINPFSKKNRQLKKPHYTKCSLNRETIMIEVFILMGIIIALVFAIMAAIVATTPPEEPEGQKNPKHEKPFNPWATENVMPHEFRHSPRSYSEQAKDRDTTAHKNTEGRGHSNPQVDAPDNAEQSSADKLSADTEQGQRQGSGPSV